MDSYVVVLPTPFARSRAGMLVSNVKKILEIKDLPYDGVWRDGDLIVVDAKDPVIASSAIRLLYGIEKVAIAQKTGGSFEEIVGMMATIGSRLLLRGDRFFVKVGGVMSGATAGDFELAATSAVIESSSSSGAVPGTVGDHNRLLYTHMVKKNAYVCMFVDGGLGGLPAGSHEGKILCCIYDEISAVACLETVKCGFDTKIIVCHTGGAVLRRLVKAADRILPRLLRYEYELEFYRLKKMPLSDIAETAMHIARSVAKKSRIRRICIPSSPIIHPAQTVDSWIAAAVKERLIPHMPLGGLEAELFVNAREAGIVGFSPAMARRAKAGRSDAAGAAKAALAGGRETAVWRGVNGIHDVLDALGGKQG